MLAGAFWVFADDGPSYFTVAEVFGRSSPSVVDVGGGALRAKVELGAFVAFRHESARSVDGIDWGTVAFAGGLEETFGSAPASVVPVLAEEGNFLEVHDHVDELGESLEGSEVGGFLAVVFGGSFG